MSECIATVGNRTCDRQAKYDFEGLKLCSAHAASKALEMAKCMGVAKVIKRAAERAQDEQAMKDNTVDRLTKEGLKEHLEGRNGEIKRLNDEVERLQAALTEIAELGNVRRDEVRSIARRALIAAE